MDQFQNMHDYLFELLNQKIQSYTKYNLETWKLQIEIDKSDDPM